MKKGDTIKLPQLADATGVQNSEFKVADVLGGGMGTCLKVTNPKHAHAFAVKIIHPHLLSSDSAWVRFIEELKLWFVLSESTGVVEAICLAGLNDVPCMCSPWMQGGTLRDRMLSKALSPQNVIDCLCRVLHTLSWVHTQHKAIHRDLKPENILFDEKGLACVADWGLAKLCGAQIRQATANRAEPIAKSPALTEAGSFLGTVLYAAPEQILGQDGIDHRADIYSLGCIMYEMEAGHPPFEGSTVAEIAAKHLQTQPPRLGGFLRRTKLGLESVIERCLRKRPQERYQDYDQLIADITRAGQRRGMMVPTGSPPLRAHRIPLGVGEFRKWFLQRMLKVDGKFALFGFDELEPYFQEFDALVSLHQWSKAREIIEPFYIPELAAPSQQWHLGHDLAVNFAVCLTMSGKAPEAVKVLSPLEDMVDQPAAFYVNHSLALIYTNSYAAAESLCATGLKRFPNNKDLFGNYVIALTSQNKLSQALSCLETLLALGRDIHFLETAALIMNSLADEAGEQDWVTCVKHRKRALDFLLEAKQQNPRFEATRFSLASTFFALEQYDAANAEYLEVAKLCGKNTDLWDSCIAGTARILLDMGAADTSIEFCKKWMPEVGDATELTRSLSIAMTKRHVIRDGQWVIVREALDFFTNAVETDSSYVEDFCYLADLLGRMERYDEAYSLLSRARVKFPRAWLVLYCRGLVEHQQGSNEDALRSLTEASRLAPYKSDPDWKMGKIYKSLGNAQMAAQFHNSCEAKKAQRRKIIEDGLGKP